MVSNVYDILIIIYILLISILYREYIIDVCKKIYIVLIRIKLNTNRFYRHKFYGNQTIVEILVTYININIIKTRNRHPSLGIYFIYFILSVEKGPSNVF